MEKEQDNNQEQDEKLLDCLARALILIAKELSVKNENYYETEPKQSSGQLD